MLEISSNQGVIMKEQMNTSSKKKLVSDLKAQMNVILRQYLSYMEVAKEFLQTCPQVTTKFIGFYK